MLHILALNGKIIQILSKTTIEQFVKILLHLSLISSSRTKTFWSSFLTHLTVHKFLVFLSLIRAILYLSFSTFLVSNFSYTSLYTLALTFWTATWNLWFCTHFKMGEWFKEYQEGGLFHRRLRVNIGEEGWPTTIVVKAVVDIKRCMEINERHCRCWNLRGGSIKVLVSFGLQVFSIQLQFLCLP